MFWRWPARTSILGEPIKRMPIKPKLIDFKEYRQFRGVDPVGEWSTFDGDWNRIESGLIYDHGETYETFPREVQKDADPAGK